MFDMKVGEWLAGSIEEHTGATRRLYSAPHNHFASRYKTRLPRL
jgi:hypothetical protein